jgi:hypothetical protein
MNGGSPTFASASTGTLTLFNTNLLTVNAFGAATTLAIGGTTATSTTNIATGATVSAATKLINIGTAGLSGSTTNINIGSALSGGTIRFNQNILNTSQTAVTGTTTITGAIILTKNVHL